MATEIETKGECAQCGTIENTRRCNGCKSVWYCSVKCQKVDWKSNHKKQCKKLKKKSNQNQKKIKKKVNKNDDDDNKENENEEDTKRIMWKCNICGFDNNIRTKKCMVCTQLGIKITAENSRPQ